MWGGGLGEGVGLVGGVKVEYVHSSDAEMVNLRWDIVLMSSSRGIERRNEKSLATINDDDEFFQSCTFSPYISRPDGVDR